MVEWYFNFFLVHCKFASCVLLFQDALNFQHSVALCDNSQCMAFKNQMFSPRTWVVCEVIILIFSFIFSKLCFELKPWTLIVCNTLQFIMSIC